MVTQVGIVPELDDLSYALRGVDEMEVVFSRRLNPLEVSERVVEEVDVEVGGTDEDFDIPRMLWMDFLLETGAIINLYTLQFSFAERRNIPAKTV